MCVHVYSLCVRVYYSYICILMHTRTPSIPGIVGVAAGEGLFVLGCISQHLTSLQHTERSCYFLCLRVSVSVCLLTICNICILLVCGVDSCSLVLFVDKHFL